MPCNKSLMDKLPEVCFAVNEQIRRLRSPGHHTCCWVRESRNLSAAEGNDNI